MAALLQNLEVRKFDIQYPMAGFWESLTDVLSAYQADPLTYLLIFFLFVIAAAIVLPIPIEIFLVIDPAVPYPLKALVMGLGKGVGAYAVYYIGFAIDRLGRLLATSLWVNKPMEFARTAARESPFLTRLIRSPASRKMRSNLRKLVRERNQDGGGSMNWGWMKWMMRGSEKLVRKYGYPAMFVIMAIPGMVDTVPLYIFSILNKEGTLMTWRGFVITNIAAGIVRAVLIWLIFFALGIEIFNVPATGA